MAISLRTDWAKIRYYVLLIFTISALLQATVTSEIQKRQLFRENLLPQIGGKVPESAFYKDRLALNQLNQNGFYTEDGFYLEQRPILRNKENYFSNTIKITLPPNNHLVAPPGRNHNPRTIDTSYTIRDPVRYSITPTLAFLPNPPPPATSLKLRQYNKQHRFNEYDASWKDVLPDQILRQLSSHIYKFLHKDD